MQPAWLSLCFVVIISFGSITAVVVKEHHKVPTNDYDQQFITSRLKSSDEREPQYATQNETRNDFTAKIIANPQNVDWTGENLFAKVMSYLNDPSTNIQHLFDEKISQLVSEEYYAGAYYLKDGLYCELIWISNKDHLSLGFKISGLTPDIEKLEKVIRLTLKEPSKEVSQQNEYMKGWYDKTYNNMNYDIEYYHQSEQGHSTLSLLHN